jgi:predicted nucleic acid-binding protein
LIFDTDILIWYLRRDRKAAALVESTPLDERHISLISYLEVIYGCRSAEELREFRLVCYEAFEEILPLDEEVSELAARFMERYVLAKRPQGEDMLIAATALSRGEGLATANLKHFDFVPGLKLKPFRP